MFYDALEAASSRGSRAAMPGNCAEVLIAKGIKYCNYSAIKQKPREIAKGNVSTCTFPRSQCTQALRAVQGELDLELSICRKC